MAYFEEFFGPIEDNYFGQYFGLEGDSVLPEEDSTDSVVIVLPNNAINNRGRATISLNNRFIYADVGSDTNDPNGIKQPRSNRDYTLDEIIIGE